MPVITIHFAHPDEAFFIVYGELRYRFDGLVHLIDDGDDYPAPEATEHQTILDNDADDWGLDFTTKPEPEADPTPAHGTLRPTKKPVATSVPCRYCGAAAGIRCHSANGNRWDGWDYCHKIRMRDRDDAWKTAQS